MSDPGSVQITLPRRAGVAVALFALGMLSLLVTQIALLEDRHETVRSQRARRNRAVKPPGARRRPAAAARAAHPWLRRPAAGSTA
jgi:hypothetical protein